MYKGTPIIVIYLTPNARQSKNHLITIFPPDYFVKIFGIFNCKHSKDELDRNRYQKLL